MNRPFLVFPSIDDQGRRVLKVHGDGIPLTERPLTLADCIRLAKVFSETALEMIDDERRVGAPTRTEA